MSWSLSLLMAVLCFLGACGGAIKSDQGLKGSCDTRELNGVCVEFYEGFRSFEVEVMCEEKTGAFSRSSCPLEGEIASCQQSHQGRVGIMRYYDHIFSLQEAKDDCQMVQGSQSFQAN